MITRSTASRARRHQGSRPRHPVLICLALLLCCCPGCTGGVATTGTPGWVASEIYLGSNIPGGGEVSEQQFSEFLATQVTPAFPAGLTVYDAYGQMQDSSLQIVKQKTKVLLLVHEDSAAGAAAVKQVILAYRSRFGNPQVMLMKVGITPEFYGN